MQRDLPDEDAQPILRDMAPGQAYQDVTVDAVKEIRDVGLEEKGRAAPVARDGSGKAGDAAQSVMGAAPRNTGVAVADKAPVKAVADGVVDDMMHNAVAEFRRPYLPDFWMSHDEGNAAADPIFTAGKFAVERNQIAFQIGLEAKLVDRIALVLAAIEIGIEDRL